MIKPQARAVLKKGAVYFGDNGERICLSCAGQTAKYSGRDRSGQKVSKVTAADAAYWVKEFGVNISCERGCTTVKA